MTPLDRATTFLFVPGDRPDRFDKAVASGADVVVLDLEDAVAPSDKDAARENVRSWLASGGRGMVRVNAYGTAWFDADIALANVQSVPVMVPKAEDPDVLAGLRGSRIVPLVETARGVEDARLLCAVPGVVRLAFGNVDLATQLGVAPDDPVALDHARGRLVLASAAAGLVAPIDGVTTNLRDETAAAHDARHARRLGFLGKLCVHPRQVGAVRSAFAPTPEELDWARRVVAAAEEAAVAVDGHLVDKPVLDRAGRLLESHDREGSHGPP